MSVDGWSRGLYTEKDKESTEDNQKHYLAGSRALSSLETLITSTETFFHPSNAGLWTLNLTTFLHRVTAEFSKRWKEEEQAVCKTPIVCSISILPMFFSATSKIILDTSAHTRHQAPLCAYFAYPSAPRNVL